MLTHWKGLPFRILSEIRGQPHRWDLTMTGSVTEDSISDYITSIRSWCGLMDHAAKRDVLFHPVHGKLMLCLRQLH